MSFTVTVTDTRTDSAGWTAQAWVTNLVTEKGAVTVPASISYASSPTGCSTPSAKQVLSGSPVVVQRADKQCSGSWTVTVTVLLPESATIADIYNATIEHSVTGLTATPATSSPAA
ncbi:hypothetical protein [Smaragdicoccus niigatensis]|uniref:hypothetical protein n=1 Tax=Smaragdicoccus niigatensis TaxID=359359 RepID=UPI000372BFEC|nr:hypothetical protein [Smaragdicoccus niigatensis]